MAGWTRKAPAGALSDKDRALLDRAFQEHAEGRMSDEDYAATKADILAHPSADPAKRKIPWAWVAAAVVVASFLVLPNLDLGGRGAESAEEHRWGAERICRQAVEKQLKDPDSAQYDDVETVVTDASPPRFGYRVTGTVRAANSFGGMAVHEFSCAATYDTGSGMAEGTAQLS